MKTKLKGATLAIAIVAILFGWRCAKAQTLNDTVSATLKVAGECVQCKQRIEKALKIPGVNSANWDMVTRILHINFEPELVNLNEIRSKILAAGHDVDGQKATDQAYNSLPSCCRYRDQANAEQNVLDHDHDLPRQITGIILSDDGMGNTNPLKGATVVFAGTRKGVVSDKNGFFSILHKGQNPLLVVSYAGFVPDSIDVSASDSIRILLTPNGRMTAIKIKAKRNSYINSLGSVRSLLISSNDLLKAACCNLSESFETNPSVDVSYSDAVTGARQIELLGLAGIYTQLTVENLPGPRGIATPLGLNSIAGPWIESIQLSKGTGSVANGYESIAGQINVQLKDAENSDKLLLNGYVNDMGKTDVNANYATKLNEKWSTILLLHDDFLYNKTDVNHDGFRDLPTGNLFSGVNKWHFENQKNIEIYFGIKALIDEKTGGQMSYTPAQKFTTSSYGLGIATNRYEGFAKIGYLFPEKTYKSIGLQLSAFDHDQRSYFGLIKYNAKQTNFYSNLIYQSQIENANHKFRTGLSLTADKYNELYKTDVYKRNETVAGGFLEYTYTMNDKFNAVIGLRADDNNLYGWFFTPRINARYEPLKGTVIRLAAGRGQRTANIFAENMAALVSARSVHITSDSRDGAYGLDPEVAWNKGISIDQKIKLFGNDGMLSFDYYRNDFVNQVVADVENPREINFYNLAGKSYSNSFQGELNFTPISKFDVRIAYRHYDVKTTYGGQLLQKPFTAADRAFVNLGYEIKTWKLNYTINYIGKKRIPSTKGNPDEYQMASYSPAYLMMNAQINKSFGKAGAFEIYAGGENLTNFFQKTVILGADQPFGQYFDASMVWGPVSGRLLYAGVRYKFK